MKMMNSRRICPADGSQYKHSAVGLVFMESAAGLAMETSKVESAVRNQADAKFEPAGACRHGFPDARKEEVAKRGKHTQDPVVVTEPAAKQLTIYKSWMSTAELNSNGERQDAINAQDGKNQWLRLSRANCLNSREQDLYFHFSHIVAAVVHLWSLGVLTAAGCGIGSVHAVVRSNLLVEPSEVSKKMMNSRRICPADGSQYKHSAVGLVFMESAAGLAMETSKVESAVRNQAEAKFEPAGACDQQEAIVYQQLRRCARYGISCDDISLDVITISSWLSADENADGLALMTSSVTSSYSADGLREQSQESAAIAKRCRLHKLIRQRFALALKIQQEDFALITSRKIPAGSIFLIPAGQPDASNSSIQSRAYLNQLLLYIQSQATVDPVASFSVIAIQSTWIPRRKKRRSSEAWQTDARSSHSDEPAAKQLTI
ncbi:glutamate receptor 2.7-like [Dorcoceras hygrometricum]|uniref:Glutamate receptor 2.7-like n=1 Tax=Dorcoceras hygrometricum TaxID=472368 RepID=A0A2Z7D7R0_9LAMI|nr:glutamate receptor 2.7-like [Dorcoceras hygrometricum]